MPPGQKTKTYNRSNIVTNSIKTSEMVHIKEKKKKKNIIGQRVKHMHHPSFILFNIEFVIMKITHTALKEFTK